MKEWEQKKQRQFLRAGIVASTIANVYRDPSKTRPFRPDDFVPKRRQVLSIEQTEKLAEAFFGPPEAK